MLDTNNKDIENLADKIIIYTDGACKGNPGVGGWGALLVYKDNKKNIYGGEVNTTNNRMELIAAIKALETLKRPCQVELWTDSNYVKNGITKWIVAWKKNNWRNANKKEVANKDLWQELDQVTQKHKISWHWVKGHSGHIGNEMADALANKGAEQVLKKL